MDIVLSKVIPIILLIGIGYMLQIRKLVSEDTMHMAKKAVMNIALPSVLFLTFKSMDLRLEYLLISIIIFFMLLGFYFVGFVLNKVPFLNHDILPFIVTGYSFGLITLPLFGAVFGNENLGVISVFGIAHEVFIWFVYITLIKAKFNNQKFDMSTIKSFATSPLIMSIVIGVFINLLGFNKFFETNFLLRGIDNTLVYLAGTATPVILIIVGFGLKLEPGYIKTPIKLLILRLLVTFGLGYIVKLLIINPIVGDVSRLFNIAYFTFLIMPPPFSLAIFVGEYSSEKNTIIANNTVVLSNVVSVIIFLVFSVFIS